MKRGGRLTPAIFPKIFFDLFCRYFLYKYGFILAILFVCQVKMTMGCTLGGAAECGLPTPASRPEQDELHYHLYISSIGIVADTIYHGIYQICCV
jgi:hypothetical protein